MTRTETVTTHDLREGDVVRDSSMRLLLTERREYPEMTTGGGPVVAFTGVVLNLPEVKAAGLVPIPWLYDNRDSHGRPVWTVQGNGLARWGREVPE